VVSAEDSPNQNLLSLHHDLSMRLRTLDCGLASLIAVVVAIPAHAQDLIPRAYLVTPAGSNAVTFAFGWNDGEIVFEPSVPIENGRGRFQTYVASYYHSFGMMGRSSNAVVSIPYGRGDFEGDVVGLRNVVYRSGLADARVRLSVNLFGGPVMTLSEFRQWREKTLIGVSVTAVVPWGQHDPARVVNPGTNRWAFKPEMGITRRRQRWVAEGHGGMWLFARNSKFYPGSAKRTQRPMFAGEGHLGYYFKPRLWASLDGNLWAGGRSSVDGNIKQDAQRESRLGGTVSIPLTRHHSLKFAYSRGAITRIGGNFQSISAAWQYSWISNPE
jgi:hypothetical protein